MTTHFVQNYRVPPAQDYLLPVEVISGIIPCEEKYPVRGNALCVPEDSRNCFEPMLGKSLRWDGENTELEVKPGAFYAMRQLLLILAGRFETTAPIVTMQAQALSSCGDIDPKYLSDNLRRLGVVSRMVYTAPHFMEDDTVVPSRGSYISLPEDQEGFIEGGDLVNAMAFSRLIAELPREVEWYQLTGAQDQGYQVQNLETLLNILSQVGIGEKFFIADDTEGIQGATLKSFRSAIRRLEALGLVNYEQYHGGYSFQPKVWDEVQILKTNWKQLHNGETAIIGYKTGLMTGESEPERQARVSRAEGIINAYNDFVENQEVPEGQPVQFTSTELMRFIRSHRAYSRLGVEPKDVQVFLRRMADPLRGEPLVDTEFTSEEEDYLFTKKEYLTLCRRVIGVNVEQTLLFRRVDFSALPGTWREFVKNLPELSELDPSYRLVIQLAEAAGRLIPREDLNRAISDLGIDIHKKGFHSRYLDAIDPERNLAGYLSIPDAQAFKVLTRIERAFAEARLERSRLAGDEKAMIDLFEENVLPIGSPSRGESIGYHMVREGAAQVLIDYLVRYRADENNRRSS